MAEEGPEHIKTYNKRSKKVKNIIASRINEHTAAYNAGIEAIVGKGKTLDDYSKLEEKGNQDKMIDAMVKFYISKAQDELKTKKDHQFEDKDDEKRHNDTLLEAYMGMTEAELKRSIKNQIDGKGGASLTATAYASMHDKHTEAINERLLRNAADHLKDEHIESIIQYSKADKYLDPSKKPRIEEATALLEIYDEGRHAVTEKGLRGAGFTKYLRDEYRKTEKKKEKEEAKV